MNNNFNWYDDFKQFYYENNKTLINKHHFDSYQDFFI